MNTSKNGAKRMDNSGDGPLQVPGFGGIPIDYELECEDRFAHGIKEWQQVPAVTARELAMIAVMNTLTDQPAWHVKIFNEKNVQEWREEAIATTTLMSEKAWNWCMEELRDKAVLFRKDEYLRVLDTGSCICKSDTLVPECLGADFQSQIAPLLLQHNKDWQPNSDGQVVNFVDPSLFPLVYDRSRVLDGGSHVDLENVLESYEHAKVTPKHLDRRVDVADIQRQIDQGATEVWGVSLHNDDSRLEDYFWSFNYQSLPSELEFTESQGTEIRITSYVNNLHPSHTELYQSIESLISLAIKPWNDCLLQGQNGWNPSGYKHVNQGQRGRVPLRILTYGVEWENEFPEWALSFNIPHPSRIERYLKAQEILRKMPKDKTSEGKEKRLRAERLVSAYGDVRDRMNMPWPSPELWSMAKEFLERPENGSSERAELSEDWAEHEGYTFHYLLRKNKGLLHHKHPEPGTAFSYQDWKAGNCNEAIVNMVTEGIPFLDNLKPVVPDHKSYEVNLQDTFRKQGLQIFVKIDGIELTPEKPKFPGGNWQLEGQKNEHIVATAMYPYDVRNVTQASISFRQETPIYEYFYRYATHRFSKEKWEHWNKPAERRGKDGMEIGAIAEILGFREELCKETDPVEDIPPYQTIGSVILPQGRLITFPNVMEHRIEPFQLVDPSLPGHHRSVKLYLVDPNYRSCSTRNVPPQQHDSWADAVSDELLKLRIPRELSTDITNRTDDWPMGYREAKEHRLAMMKEHRWKDMARYSWQSLYGFW